MQLKDLIKNIECEVKGSDKTIVRALSLSPDDCLDSLFFCYRGVKNDGHDYYKKAESGGAVALVVERFLDSELPQIKVPDGRRVIGQICSDFYCEPYKGLKMIGVCGTNGKTTTTFMLKHIFEAAGHKVCLIGTSGVIIGKLRLPATLTTPDPPMLHKLLRKAYDKGCTVVVMEVSAHAIDLYKLEGIKFDLGIFTNLTQDHLDYFGDMESYAATKQKFFDGFCERAVFNFDDECGRRFFESCPAPKSSFGQLFGDYRADIIKSTLEGSEFTVSGLEGIMKINMAGRFNIYNALSAAAGAGMLGVSCQSIREGLMQLSHVEGRFNVFNFDRVFVVIDYAHSPDGVFNILKAVREVTDGRILTVFGCGGDRDSLKRPVMGRIVADLSDEVIITSDNPRSENPEDIIAQIRAGIEEGRDCVCETSRKEAIFYALSRAEKGAVVVILGKGAETTQEIGGIKYPFSDEAVVRQFFENGTKGEV